MRGLSLPLRNTKLVANQKLLIKFISNSTNFSLYALMHAILRTIQTMALDGLVFKFFGGKFESNQFRCEWQLKQKEQEQPVLGCLIFSLLAAVLAGLLDVKQLLNLLSIGTLLVFLTLPMDVILLRWV